MDTDTLEFPPIAEPAAQPVATVETKQATLKETTLASFAPIVAHMTTLAQRYRNVAFDLLTPKGMAAAKAARLELREEGRYAVQRLQKRLKDEANDLKRTIDAKAEEAIGIVKPVEDAIHEQIEARETQLAAEKAERERIEVERKAGHEAGIAKVRAYLSHCQQQGMTAARIQAGIDMLRAATFGPEWEEFAVPAANAQCETLEAMQRLHADAVAREEAAARAAEEAARIEAQRVENERIAAEQAAESARLAVIAADLKRQADELAAQQAAAEAREQAVARANREQAAFEDWARKTSPSGDVESVQRQWEASADYHELHGLEYLPIIEGKAETPEAGSLEAAPIQWSEMAVSQIAGQHSQESACSTQAGRQDDCALGGADEARGIHAEDCEDLSGVATGPLHPLPADTTSGAAPLQAGVQLLRDELDIARAGYSHEADAVPGGTHVFARDIYPGLGYVRWENFDTLIQRCDQLIRNGLSDGEIEPCKRSVSIGSGAVRVIEDYRLDAKAHEMVQLLAGSFKLTGHHLARNETGILSLVAKWARSRSLQVEPQKRVGRHVVDLVVEDIGIEFDEPHHADGRQAAKDETKTAECMAAGFSICRFGLASDAVDVIIEVQRRLDKEMVLRTDMPAPIADSAAAADIANRVILVMDPEDEDDEGGIDANDLHMRCGAVVAHALGAFDTKFPTHPKPSQEWWAELRRLLGDDLLPRLMATTEARN